jgi:alkylated DNA repair dioxygenase AlkB
MEQLNLFDTQLKTPKFPSDLMEYHKAVLDRQKSAGLLQVLIHTIDWERKTIKMYGKEHFMPRLMAWYGESGKTYAFSGTTYVPKPFTAELTEIKQLVETIAGLKFNSVLINYYRDGNDSMGWHADDENELGQNPVIASLSLGQERRFDIRNKKDHKNKFSVLLESGSLLLMKGDMQHHWEHSIAKTKKPMEARLNLTFRQIYG